MGVRLITAENIRRLPFMKTKKLLAGALILAMVTGCLSGCAAPKTETPQIDGYNLLWSDEFDGNKLDETKWNKELRDPGWTNNELQEYTDSEQNIYVKDESEYTLTIVNGELTVSGWPVETISAWLML